MMTQQRPKSPAHPQLARLSQEVAAARVAEREARTLVEEAQASVENLKETIRDAYSNSEATSELSAQLQQAREHVEESQLRAEGFSRATGLTDNERHSFLAANAHILLKELEPEARAVVADIATQAQALVEADRRWTDLQGRVNEYLVAMGLTSAGNAPATHSLASIVRDLRHSPLTVASPLPHFVHRDAQREDDQNKRSLRSRRTVI
jgi:uncharacterized protein YgfB (UPF0149 family)